MPDPSLDNLLVMHCQFDATQAGQTVFDVPANTPSRGFVPFCAVFSANSLGSVARAPHVAIGTFGPYKEILSDTQLSNFGPGAASKAAQVVPIDSATLVYATTGLNVGQPFQQIKVTTTANASSLVIDCWLVGILIPSP